MLSMLLVQNQQLIMQQQNMMFMVLNQYQGNSQAIAQSQLASASCQQASQQTASSNTTLVPAQSQQQQLHIQSIPQTNSTSLSPTSSSQVPTSDLNMQQLNNSQHNNSHQRAHHIHINQHEHEQQQLIHEQQQLLEQQHNELQHHQIHILDQFSDQQLSDPQTDISSAVGAISENDSEILFNPSEHTTLVYNPQADIGPITPYKDRQSMDKYSGFQSMSDYSAASSAAGSLTTPRMYNNAASSSENQEHHHDNSQQVNSNASQQQATRPAVSSNVVKNLAQSFKSPVRSSPGNNINVQFVPNSKQNLKDNKAKVIQQLRISNISKFLRQVHPETIGVNNSVGQNY